MFVLVCSGHADGIDNALIQPVLGSESYILNIKSLKIIFKR